MVGSLVEIEKNVSDASVDYSTNLGETISSFAPAKGILRAMYFFPSRRHGKATLKFRLFSVGKTDILDSVRRELEEKGLRFLEPLEALVFAESNPKLCSGFELLPALNMVESSCAGRWCIAFSLTAESISGVEAPYCDKVKPNWLIVAVPK